MSYKEFIENILNTRGRFACGDEYHERHHIIPRCMDGTDEEENLIDLFAREHFEAHRLLALENPQNEKLKYAWWAMCRFSGSSKKRDKITPEEYEEVRTEIANICSKNFSGKGNPMYGSHRTGKDNPHYGRKHSEETKELLRKINIGKKYSKETNKKKGLSGEKNPMYGRKHSEETKKILSKQKTGKNNVGSKKVVQYSLDGKFIKVWNCIADAERMLGLNNSISPCCRKKQDTAGGFKWYYLYDQSRKDGVIIQGAITLGLITEGEVDCE